MMSYWILYYIINAGGSLLKVIYRSKKDWEILEKSPVIILFSDALSNDGKYV